MNTVFQRGLYWLAGQSWLQQLMLQGLARMARRTDNQLDDALVASIRQALQRRT